MQEEMLALFNAIKKEIKEVNDDIIFTEKALEDKTRHYTDLTELKNDLSEDRRKLLALAAQESLFLELAKLNGTYDSIIESEKKKKIK